MSYLVLARKFRPQTFASIIGQDHITRALANAILWNRVPHALLFTGPRGVGKTTSARVFARALNCTGRKIPAAADFSGTDARASVEPCGECANCREIAKSISLSVWEIDGASNNSVDNVRELIDSLRSLPPPGSRYKIYIIDEVHMLSTAAFNALLKSLEEPPPNTVFIFATTEPHKIPETVISRCQRHDFRRLRVETIVQSLQEVIASEGLEADEAVLEFVALKAQGGLRDAQSMLDRLITFSSGKLNLETAVQLFGVVDSSFFFELSAAVFAQETARCFELLDKAFSQSLDVRQFGADFLTHWRNLLLVASAGASKSQDDQLLRRALEVPKRDVAHLKDQAQSIELFQLQRLFDLAEETTQKAMASLFPRFIFEAGVAKMATLQSLRPLAEIIGELQGKSGRLPAAAQSKQERPAVVARNVSAVETEAIEVQPETLSETSSESRPPFDGSWEKFINFVRSSRSEPVLAAFLRRVAPQSFIPGRLTLGASEFDARSLKEPETMALLKTCLQTYSGISGWEVRFEEVVAAKLPSGGDPASGRRISGEPLSGSLAMVEKIAEKQRVSQIASEARQDPAIQAALSMFEGSAIERVNIVKK